jgi:hypothetical protein
MKMPRLNDSIKEKALYLIKPNQYPNQAVEQFELLSLLGESGSPMRGPGVY